MNSITAVIPTLQKNKDFLYKLISTLDKDSAVKEIILIDNSLKGFPQISNKLKVIIPKENLYVNPSWNLGISQAKSEIIALLNDDITIPEKFCSKVTEQMTSQMGAIGFDINFVKIPKDIPPTPTASKIIIKRIYGRCKHWGIAIFLYKKNFTPIPNCLKIFYGDDWIIREDRIKGRKTYCITGQKIYHFGSLTSKQEHFNPIAQQDKINFKRITKRWWHQTFYFERIYRGFKFTILGIGFTYHTNKNH